MHFDKDVCFPTYFPTSLRGLIHPLQNAALLIQPPCIPFLHNSPPSRSPRLYQITPRSPHSYFFTCRVGHCVIFCVHNRILVIQNSIKPFSFVIFRISYFITWYLVSKFDIVLFFKFSNIICAVFFSEYFLLVIPEVGARMALRVYECLMLRTSSRRIQSDTP